MKPDLTGKWIGDHFWVVNESSVWADYSTTSYWTTGPFQIGYEPLAPYEKRMVWPAQNCKTGHLLHYVKFDATNKILESNEANNYLQVCATMPATA